jgi:hypothetical protein
MDNKSYQKKYRKSKEKLGWKYFSVIIPADCYLELKKFYLELKSKNLEKWNNKL